MTQESGILPAWIRFARHALGSALAAPWVRASRCLSPAAAAVPPDFLGLCVATQEDPACDEYVLAHVKELGIRHVRLDFTYGDEGSWMERLLLRLEAEGYGVCLHLVQPRDEAARMAEPAVRDAWRSFVGRTLDRHGSRIEMVEPATTCNRRQWTGHNLHSFLEAWRIARAEASARGVTVAGPNVTDFEPVYNAGLLGIMAADGVLPDVHSDNLFVERATQPEAWDPKIIGRALAPLAGFNLVKKARVLRRIGEHYGVPKLMCTHVAWSRRRIERRLVASREKQADYVARYLCLAAATGCLDRVYWGPLIGQREGLIDDGTDAYPDLPRVACYGVVPGAVSGYSVLPAFRALRTFAGWVPGARFSADFGDGERLFILEFTTDGHRLHVVWTANGLGVPASACYDPACLRAAEAIGRDGTKLTAAPCDFSESPTYLRWPLAAEVSVKGRPAVNKALRFDHASAAPRTWTAADGWEGVAATSPDRPTDALDLLPDKLAAGPRTVLREGRNTVWQVQDPLRPGRSVVVKRFRARPPLRRLLDCGKPSRAARAWSGANELLRRGLGTPRPIAFFQRAGKGSAGESSYVCEAVEDAWTVRQAFTAFATGASQWRDMKDVEVFDPLAGFIRLMHERGVFFRDLSAGNVLARPRADGRLEFLLIDTTRLRAMEREVPFRQRLSDLKRIVHPLAWAGRRAFLSVYLSGAGRRLSSWMLLPVAVYDLKHRVKNALRRRGPP
jgi:hypothetical protein